MNKELTKTYEPQEAEGRIYQFWLSGGYFHAEVDLQKDPYTIVIPPPSITDQLHMGHVPDETLRDILIRWRRMQGYSVLWLPDTGHASIATEVKIVKAMRKEGITKEEIGREGSSSRVWDWKEKYGGIIIGQLRELGCSCDWECERFTLDEGCSEVVREVFVCLYGKGLIYRGERIINWRPHCRALISDAEAEFSEYEGSFWYPRYLLGDGSGDTRLATTRPEIMLGDIAVVVYLGDERYRHLVGKTVILPLVDKEIPIIADSYVESEFGTGVVKIIPAHDPNDFEAGLCHNLPVINVMDEAGVINENGDKYRGVDRLEMRKQAVKDLDEQGYLIKVEPIKHNIGFCYRCSTIVESCIPKQWSVQMQSLAKPVTGRVKGGEAKFVPERFEEIYYHRMENIRNWCTPRQLWWGHRIPTWYYADCGEMTTVREASEKCPKCGSHHLHQDSDTPDTWPSSALWPFSTLGWPKNTEDLKHFYPTSTLVTGYDIIFFWMVRMIFSAIEQTGQVPFDTVLIHGLARNAQGRKMPKSFGNDIDPLEVTADFGADALYFTFATGNSPGNDLRFSDDKVSASRNSANKIRNAARFIRMNIEGHEMENRLPEHLAQADRWITGTLHEVVEEITENLEKFKLSIAVQKLYDLLWDDLCDWYIEITKIHTQDEDEQTTQSARQTLVWVVPNTLKLLHSFMPFITEKIRQSLPREGDSIMTSKWSEYDAVFSLEQDRVEVCRVMDAIRAVHNRRAEMNTSPSRKAHLSVAVTGMAADTFCANVDVIFRLVYASQVEIVDSWNLPDIATIVADVATLYIPIDELVDKKVELTRLEKELESIQKQLDSAETKLKNETFLFKAPDNVVGGVRKNVEKLTEKVAGIRLAIQNLSKQ